MRRASSSELGLRGRARRAPPSMTREARLLQPLRPARSTSEPRGRYAGYDCAAALDPSRRPAARCCSTPSRERLGDDRACSSAGAASRVDQDADGVTLAFRRPRAPRDGKAARSAATASIRRCAAAPSRTKARRATRASTCGAASTRWPPFLGGATMVSRRLADGRQDGDLSDPRRRSTRRPPARQLGRRDRDGPRRCARTGPAAAGSTTSCRPSPDWHFDWLDVAGDDPRRPRRCSNTRWSTRIRCRAGASAASRCSATPRIRCTRAAPTAPARRSSTRAASPALIGSAAPTRRGAAGLRGGAQPGDGEGRADQPQRPARRDPARGLRRTGDQPFARIEDVISEAELRAMSEGYRPLFTAHGIPWIRSQQRLLAHGDNARLRGHPGRRRA